MLFSTIYLNWDTLLSQSKYSGIFIFLWRFSIYPPSYVIGYIWYIPPVKTSRLFLKF